jgi:multidrug efflux pump subunit AcrA (membrane-fusion protein)
MIKSKKILFFVGIALGIGALVMAVSSKQPPVVKETFNRASLVEVQALSMTRIAPEVKAYGRVMPKHIWRGVSEVKGRVVYRHPQLESGRLLPANTLLLKIDPVEYQLQVAQAEANLNASQVKLSRLDQEQKNLNTNLKLERQKLALAQQELKRKRDIHKRALVSDSELEQQEQSYFNQLKQVQDIENNLKLLPDDRKVTAAQLKVDQLKLVDAQRNLSKTKVSLPFDARISVVNIEKDQVVNLGEVMVEAFQLDSVEVKAELSVNDLRNLINSIGRFNTSGELPSIEKLPLQAEIEFSTPNQSFNWPAKVTRVADAVDAETATIGVYLEVKQDFRHLNLPDRPPLGKGMFVSAYIKGLEQSHFVVPEKAVHGRDIYLMTEEGTLRITPIDILFRTRQGVVIQPRISPNTGEKSQLITNDLIPAIEGMSVRVLSNSPTEQSNSLTATDKEGK